MEAGEGNRTLVSALGRPHSTIEPHPPPLRFGMVSPPKICDVLFLSDYRTDGNGFAFCDLKFRFPRDAENCLKAELRTFPFPPLHLIFDIPVHGMGLQFADGLA